MLAGRNKDQGHALVKRLGDSTGRKDDFLFVPTDVGQLAQVKALFDATIAKFGDFYCLVNNAGISGIYISDILKGTDDWITTMNVNLIGALQASRIALTHWLRNKKKGLIINTGSISEFLGHTDPTYVISKAGMSAQASTLKSMADLTGTPYGRMSIVRAVTIAVGFVYTNIWVNNSGGKWTTKEHVENDPSFGPDLKGRLFCSPCSLLFFSLKTDRSMPVPALSKVAGGWTDINRVVDVYMKVIDDESISGDTLIVAGDFPVQRKRLHLSKEDWARMMTNKATAVL